jgi:hypothetical protein
LFVFMGWWLWQPGWHWVTLTWMEFPTFQEEPLGEFRPTPNQTPNLFFHWHHKINKFIDRLKTCFSHQLMGYLPNSEKKFIGPSCSQISPIYYIYIIYIIVVYIYMGDNVNPYIYIKLSSKWFTSGHLLRANSLSLAWPKRLWPLPPTWQVEAGWTWDTILYEYMILIWFKCNLLVCI